ncbi:tetratricopeptide repeat protein [Chlorobium sp. KB01]|uniref:tetratricopeptide repeat protein n=1 Tax=Chlorobium sp. KB01 TaxID=1917528 RepID=UPI000977978A|nr:tetratricopeptide repeat protein [Chlorobium sp. KB01]
MLKDAMGGYRGTAIEISRVIQADPDNADAYCNRANALSSTGDYRDAIDDYTTALKIGLRFREAITAYGNRGIARLNVGDIYGALEDFSEIIRRKPGNNRLLHAAYNSRASVKEKIGDKEGAAEDRMQASMLSPDVQ